VDQSAVLSRIRVFGSLRVQEKVFSRIRKLVAAGQGRPLLSNPQIDSFQMSIGNLRGLDFGFGSLPPTACGGVQIRHWGTLTVPRLPKIQSQLNSGETVKIELSQRLTAKRFCEPPD
jgi:hypothetical protein